MPRNAAYHEKLKAKGKCISCGHKSLNSVECRKCGRRKERQKAKRRKELRKAGLCVRCHEPSETYECFDCSEARNIKRRMRYAENRVEVAAKHKKIYEDKKANGICIRCTNKAVNGLLCKMCTVVKELPEMRNNEVIEVMLTTGEESTISDMLFATNR